MISQQHSEQLHFLANIALINELHILFYFSNVFISIFGGWFSQYRTYGYYVFWIELYNYFAEKSVFNPSVRKNIIKQSLNMKVMLNHGSWKNSFQTSGPLTHNKAHVYTN